MMQAKLWSLHLFENVEHQFGAAPAYVIECR